VRPEFEAYIREEWLARLVDENMINRFLHREEPSPLDCLLVKLEATDFKKNVLSHLKKKYWKAMCDYVHTGGRQVRNWITTDSIQPNYSSQAVLEVIRFAETIASPSVVGLAHLADDDDLAKLTWEAYEKRQTR
jgi:Family of unknown function (DUF6988)